MFLGALLPRGCAQGLAQLHDIPGARRDGTQGPPSWHHAAVSLRWPRGKRPIPGAESGAEPGEAGPLCPHTPAAGDVGAGAEVGASGASRCQCFHGKHPA